MPVLQSTPDPAFPIAAIRLTVAHGGLDLSAQAMSSADQSIQLDDDVNPAVQPPLPGKMTPLHSDHFNHQGA